MGCLSFVVRNVSLALSNGLEFGIFRQLHSVVSQNVGIWFLCLFFYSCCFLMGSTSQVPRRSKFSIIVVLYLGVYKWKESIRRLSLFALNYEVGEEGKLLCTSGALLGCKGTTVSHSFPAPRGTH